MPGVLPGWGRAKSFSLPWFRGSGVVPAPCTLQLQGCSAGLSPPRDACRYLHKMEQLRENN